MKFSSGSSSVSLMMETPMSRVAWKRNWPPTSVRVKSPWPKLKLLVSGPIVRALGGGVVGRRSGQGDSETVLRHFVRRGGGLGLQDDRCCMLVDAHERLIPADGDGYEVVVRDLYAHNGWSALQVRWAGVFAYSMVAVKSSSSSSDVSSTMGTSTCFTAR